MAIALTKALRLGLLASLLISPVLAADKEKSNSTVGCNCLWDMGDIPDDKVKFLDDATTKTCQGLYGKNAPVVTHIGAKTKKKKLLCSNRRNFEILQFGTACRKMGHAKGARCCDTLDVAKDDCEYDVGLAVFACMHEMTGTTKWGLYNAATAAACKTLGGKLNDPTAHVEEGVYTCLAKNSGDYDPANQVKLWGPACLKADGTGIQINPRGSQMGHLFSLPYNETEVKRYEECSELQAQCLVKGLSWEQCLGKIPSHC